MVFLFLIYEILINLDLPWKCLNQISLLLKLIQITINSIYKQRITIE